MLNSVVWIGCFRKFIWQHHENKIEQHFGIFEPIKIKRDRAFSSDSMIWKKNWIYRTQHFGLFEPIKNIPQKSIFFWEYHLNKK